MDYNQQFHRRINKLFLKYLFKQNLFFFILLLLINHRSEAQNLTLVTSALRTFQTHACDGQLLHLNCKPNTVVSILFAQYGISNGQICPNNNLTSSSPINEDISSSKNCTESLRYSLLQKVESTCREKSNCIIDSSTRSLGVTDRCPNTAKYAEVAYKCRPYTFQNKIACSEKSIDITCPFNQRILIYSAFFGTSSRTPPECAKNTIPSHLLKVHQPNTIKKPFKEYCVAKQVTKLVADRCHTQTNCSINAQFNQFQLPECINDLTNDDKQTQIHLKVTYACVQNEVLRTNLIGSISINNNLSNSITNTFNINNKINYTPQNKTTTTTKDSSLTNSLNELSTKISILNKPEFNNDLYENNLLPSTEFNHNKNTLLDQEIQPTENDNLLNIRPNEPQSPWPHQINELNLDFKTPKSNEPFKDWSSFCQYIENNLERLLVYLLVILCVALLFCFIFLGFSHLNDKTKKTEQQCSSLECSVQEDCCDSKPDLSNSVSLNKGNHVSSVFAGFQSFEDDNPTMDEMIGELHRNGSFIGMQQQLHNQLSNQLAQQNCKSISNQILLSANTAAVVANESVGSLLNCHQLNNQINNQMVNNRFTSTFSPTHNNYNSIDKYNNSYFQNTIYSNQQNSPQKLLSNALPQSTSFYNMQTYTPTIYTSTNPTIVGNYTHQSNLQQPTDQTTFQQLQPAQLLISNQSDNENGSTTTTMTTIGSQTDSSSSTEMANSTNGILHSNINNLNNQIHSSIHNNQMNSISPSNFNPVTLQILTTPNHLNDVQLNEATVYQQNL